MYKLSRFQVAEKIGNVGNAPVVSVREEPRSRLRDIDVDPRTRRIVSQTMRPTDRWWHWSVFLWSLNILIFKAKFMARIVRRSSRLYGRWKRGWALRLYRGQRRARFLSERIPSTARETKKCFALVRLVGETLVNFDRSKENFARLCSCVLHRSVDSFDPRCDIRTDVTRRFRLEIAVNNVC